MKKRKDAEGLVLSASSRLCGFGRKGRPSDAVQPPPGFFGGRGRVMRARRGRGGSRASVRENGRSGGWGPLPHARLRREALSPARPFARSSQRRATLTPKLREGVGGCGDSTGGCCARSNSRFSQASPTQFVGEGAGMGGARRSGRVPSIRTRSKFNLPQGFWGGGRVMRARRGRGAEAASAGGARAASTRPSARRREPG